ncbi:hypothetical protein [Streptosporangium sp. NPDC000509]|uniref:hypothetical protein n=1 Tax=Streptosporangium sp. NPDC000509 TaxID=3366186 RepID=UPI0036BD4C9F
MLLDDRTLLVITRVGAEKRRLLWSYDLVSGKLRRIAEFPNRNSTLIAENVTVNGGNIAWWASYKEPGKQRVARIWTVPVGGGTPRKVTDVPLEDVMKKGHIRALEVVGSDVVFSRESGGVYTAPLRGGTPHLVPGTEGQHLLRWPWVGSHSKQAVFAKLFNIKTRERRDAVVRPGEKFVRCGVNRCYGHSSSGGPGPRVFARDRDGSREQTLPSVIEVGDDPGLERFYKGTLMKGVVLHDALTGTSADLGVRQDKQGVTTIPDGGFDRLMAYQVGKEMYVVDLAAIE